MDRDQITGAVQLLLGTLVPDWMNDHDLHNTPLRVARMYEELLTPVVFQMTVFPNEEGYNQIVLVKDIAFHSLCPHHLLPFSGTAAVAYIPDKWIAGLSKLARLVEHASRGLRTQEALTQIVGTHLVQRLSPVGAAVIVEAEHLCMRMRGVRSPSSKTTTSFMAGAFLDKPAARAELLQLIYGRLS